MVLLYLLIGLFVLSQTLSNTLSSRALKKTKYENAYTVVWQLCSGIFMLFTLPFVKLYARFDIHLLILFGISLVFWALTNAFLFKAYKTEDVSILTTVYPLYNVIAFGITALFFNARMNGFILIGFFLIILASFLTGFYRTKLRPSKGVIFILLSVLFEGIAFGVSIPVVKVYSSFLYIAVGFIIPGLINQYFFLRPKVAHLQYEIRKQWKTIIINAIIVDLLYIFEYAALNRGNVSQVVSFGEASTFLTVMIGILFLRERSHIKIKLLAALLATVGVILAQR
jgi:drug/metabolite transporter (DMT)-like permease